MLLDVCTLAKFPTCKMIIETIPSLSEHVREKLWEVGDAIHLEQSAEKSCILKGLLVVIKTMESIFEAKHLQIVSDFMVSCETEIYLHRHRLLVAIALKPR